MRKERVSGAVPTLLFVCLALVGCDGPSGELPADDPAGESIGGLEVRERLDQYATYRLTADLEPLSAEQHRILRLLIDAARHADSVFWLQAYGEPGPILDATASPAARRYLEINYGPWDRLADDESFLGGIGPKPAGANFYPRDLTAEAFRSALEGLPEEVSDHLRSQYTLVRRADDGRLRAIPYHEAYSGHARAIADRLRAAARLAEDPGLRRYLELRAEAILSDEYRESDRAWLEMKTNTIDVVIGPIETYEDQLFGYKAAYEGLVLIKDRAWSERLSHLTTFLPELQLGLPVPERYRRETPGTESELNAYDAVYYSGHANAGPKAIAVNLPNDEVVQLEKGTRRLQLKNAVRAKFDSILVPISRVLIAPNQREHVTFDAFFANTMFHEVAHGLGIKNTVTGKGTVREALKEHASAMEEGKADILGLYMLTRLQERGVLQDRDLKDNYVTFLASIFRSVRFGAASAHGRANMVRFNFFREHGAFSRDSITGTYRVDFDRMTEAMTSLSELILTIQGDGDHAAAGRLLAEKGVIGSELRSDLDRLAEHDIPVDIIFEQGPSVLGLESSAAAP